MAHACSMGKGWGANAGPDVSWMEEKLRERFNR